MNKEWLMQLVLAPHSSEKTEVAADGSNQHCFRVHPQADKKTIRKAIELLFGVHVEKIQCLRVKGKKKRHGRFQGKRPDWKKAMVRLREGEDINLNALEK